jgi:hypothetical protein
MSLRRRLAKLEGEIGPVSVTPTYDLRLLHPEEVDFICQFTFRPPDDQDFIQNIPVIADLLRECEIEPLTPGIRTIMPEFPRGLQMYWRHQRFVNGEIELPQGNYDFRNLTFAAQARFQILCTQHGWEPEAANVEIEPLPLWSGDELAELCELLERAIPQSEKVAMRWRNNELGEV